MQLKEICKVTPHIHYLPEYDPKVSTDWHGIKALWYEGAKYQGKKTKVFAYIGYPEIADGESVPAVVLVHGGGGHAYPEWIRKWNEKGFAAIAMDTTGYFPVEEWKGLVGTEENADFKYVRELYGDLQEEGYTVGPDNERMMDCHLPMGEQWMYHAVADTILAHNILVEDARIDNDKIGIVGISWGAVITSIAIGYDNRYAFATPIYGSAFLDYLPAPQLPRIFREPLVNEQWNAAKYLEKTQFPILWQCWCYDAAFSIGANSLSYKETKKNHSFLSMHLDMNHSHWHGWTAVEPYRFARKTIEKRLPFARVVTEPEGYGRISFEIEVPEDFADLSAQIFYLTDPIEYDENNKMIKEWQSVHAEIQDGYVEATIPEEAYCYFAQMRGYADGEFYITSSALVEKEFII